MKTQKRCKCDFGKRIRRIKRNIREGEHVYIDPTDGMSKTGELESPALGLFHVLKNDGRTFVIQRDKDVEPFNADSRTYAPPLENAPPPEAFAPTADNISKNSEGPTYAVEKLLEYRVTYNETLEFHVKWYG